jgi:hypothetical protein
MRKRYPEAAFSLNGAGVRRLQEAKANNPSLAIQPSLAI